MVRARQAITASRLREDVYRILDEILETGCSVEIKRKGRVLRIVGVEKGTRLSRLVKRRCIVGDPEDLVHLDWSAEWRGRDIS